jgi:hypothetical protein
LVYSQTLLIACGWLPMWQHQKIERKNNKAQNINFLKNKLNYFLFNQFWHVGFHFSFKKLGHFWHIGLYAISFFWINLGIWGYMEFHIGHVQFNEGLDFLKIFNLASSHSNGHEVYLLTTKKCYFKNVFNTITLQIHWLYNIIVKFSFIDNSSK